MTDQIERLFSLRNLAQNSNACLYSEIYYKNEVRNRTTSALAHKASLLPFLASPVHERERARKSVARHILVGTLGL